MVKFKFPQTLIRFLLIVVICLLISSSVWADQKDQQGEAALKASKDQEGETIFPVPPPLVYQGLFPCRACHRKDSRGVSSQADRGKSFLGKFLRAPDPRPRILVRMHRDINLKHSERQWCLDCHNSEERNYLRLINGEILPFEKSYQLCGQCHGLIFRDWKLGIHGRRVGQWNGKKLYLLCAHCHDPHSPKFRKLMAQDPPRAPSYGRWGSGDEPANRHAD